MSGEGWRARAAVEALRRRYEVQTGDMVVDDNPETTHSADGGVWVRAWVYVSPEAVEGEV